MARYGKKSKEKVGKAMHEMKRGKLKSGAKTRKKVKSRKQAIAIGLSQARREGGKVPSAPKGSKSRKKTAKRSTRKKAAKRKGGRKKKS